MASVALIFGKSGVSAIQMLKKKADNFEFVNYNSIEQFISDSRLQSYFPNRILLLSKNTKTSTGESGIRMLSKYLSEYSKSTEVVFSDNAEDPSTDIIEFTEIFDGPIFTPALIPSTAIAILEIATFDINQVAAKYWDLDKSKVLRQLGGVQTTPSEVHIEDGVPSFNFGDMRGTHMETGYLNEEDIANLEGAQQGEGKPAVNPAFASAEAFNNNDEQVVVGVDQQNPTILIQKDSCLVTTEDETAPITDRVVVVMGNDERLITDQAVRQVVDGNPNNVNAYIDFTPGMQLQPYLSGYDALLNTPRDLIGTGVFYQEDNIHFYAPTNNCTYEDVQTMQQASAIMQYNKVVVAIPLQICPDFKTLCEMGQPVLVVNGVDDSDIRYTEDILANREVFPTAFYNTLMQKLYVTIQNVPAHGNGILKEIEKTILFERINWLDRVLS